MTDSDEEERNTDRRIGNLIDFFFTIVKSQRNEESRKGSGGSCFKSETSPQNEVKTYVPKVNKELEEKMETLMNFLATTGCMSKDDIVSKDDRKITLMEFLLGSEERNEINPVVETNLEREHKNGLRLSENNINVQGMTYIDDTPGEEGSETLVEMLIKYMEDYSSADRYKEPTQTVTPSLSEKSKSEVTISRLETFSDMSKTKSDSSLNTRTQDTVIDKYEEFRSEKSPNSRRISETTVDFSHVKVDLESIFEEAADKIYQMRNVKLMRDCDTMTEEEDKENFQAYTPPAVQYLQYLPYSFELSDIMEEDEPSSRYLERKSSRDERLQIATRLAHELLRDIEDKVQTHLFEDDNSSSKGSREMDKPSLRRSSVSLIDLRNIPDLPPSVMAKPKVVRVDKSTSTIDMSDSLSDVSKRIDSDFLTDDTTLSSTSEPTEREIKNIGSLQNFFSKSKLEIINETLEENGAKKSNVVDSSSSSSKRVKENVGQASLDDVEDLVDDNDRCDGVENDADGMSV